MRLFGVLALAAAVAIGILFIAVAAVRRVLDERSRTLGPRRRCGRDDRRVLDRGRHLPPSRIRFGRLVKAAERLAAGNYETKVKARGTGLEGRLAPAINGIAAAMTESNNLATFDRLTGVANRSALLAALFAEVERAGRYERPLSVAFVDIDHFKTVNDSYGHAAGDMVLRGVAQTTRREPAGQRHDRPLRRRGVHADPDRDRRRRRLRPDGEAPQPRPAPAVRGRGQPGAVGHDLDRHRRRRRDAPRGRSLVRDADAAMYSAKSLGRNQTYIFAEPDDDARVPRAPISSAGRARAIEIGRQARKAATAALASYILPLPHYRGQPSALIASIVVEIARQLELPEAEIDRIQLAALLHDVGKVAIPEEILEKPSALSTGEWRSVVQHPRIGQVILEQAAALKDAVPIILHHHERFAGHGYPYGLRGNEIPLGARIVAIADAYDAMIHDRPYKRAMSHDQAIAELRRHAGTQFDPDLVNLFCDLYAVTAPEPDPTVLAMIRRQAAPTPRKLVLPDIGAVAPRPRDARPGRRPCPRSRPRRTAPAAGRRGSGTSTRQPTRPRPAAPTSRPAARPGRSAHGAARGLTRR